MSGRARVRDWLGGLGALALLAAMPAAATHAPDHRFIVLGFVTDAQGQPLANVPVALTRVKTGLVYRARSERDGLYLIVVHIHDEDEGESLELAAHGVTGRIRARFDPRDRRVERGTRADVRGRDLVEDRASFAETLRAFLAR